MTDHHDVPVQHDIPAHREPSVHREPPAQLHSAADPSHPHSHSHSHQDDRTTHGSQHHDHGAHGKHGHGHGDHHGHQSHGGGDAGQDTGTHDHQHKHNDEWSGDEYLNYPGLRELAKFSHKTVLYALREAGLTDKDIKALNLLEVGCGAGAVTQLLAESFASVHAIDVSPSMLATFSDQLPSSKYPTVTHSHHTLSSTSREVFRSGTTTPVPSPTKAEPGRTVKLPRQQWDVAVVNLVLHHVDDLEGFMVGLQDLVVKGGWVVFTEFTNLKFHRTETKDGSVNAPHHYHDEYNADSISELLSTRGWIDVYTEVRGKMRIWRNDQFHDVDCLIARAKKSS